MKKLNIFIDFAGTASDADKIFGKKIKERINGIKKDFSISGFEELRTTEDNWEQKSIIALDKADIIIVVISSDYLSFVSPKIEAKFNKIIESKNKYLFPILYRPADWGSFNWLVKSKLIPEDNRPLTDYSSSEEDKVINQLVKLIDEILSKQPKKEPTKKVSTKAIVKIESRVFISHSHEDADFAELLKLQLEKNGIESWVDNDRLKIGQDWREEIDDGITRSIAVIAIMTPEARKSEYVTYEWAYAWGKGKKIFPIMLKQTQLHPRLESLQYLDFTNRNTRPYDDLIKSLQILLK